MIAFLKRVVVFIPAAVSSRPVQTVAYGLVIACCLLLMTTWKEPLNNVVCLLCGGVFGGVVIIILAIVVPDPDEFSPPAKGGQPK